MDISDRASPTVVGALRSPYVLAIDYRDSVITEKGCDATAIGGQGRGCSVVVADDLNTVYITSYECNGGYSVDTSDKTNPTFTAGDRSIGVISGPVAMVNKHVDGGGDYLFIAANGGNTEMAHGLVVLDFTRGQTAIALGDEGNTAVVDELQSDGATAVALNYDATRAYVTSNVRDGSLLIYDVSEPMAPERISILSRSSLSTPARSPSPSSARRPPSRPSPSPGIRASVSSPSATMKQCSSAHPQSIPTSRASLSRRPSRGSC